MTEVMSEHESHQLGALSCTQVVQTSSVDTTHPARPLPPTFNHTHTPTRTRTHLRFLRSREFDARRRQTSARESVGCFPLAEE